MPSFSVLPEGEGFLFGSLNREPLNRLHSSRFNDLTLQRFNAFFPPRWSPNVKPVRASSRTIGRSAMKKNRSFALALAGALVVCPQVSPATTLAEGFATDPLARNWIATGNTNLFHWNAANQNLEVTWDSSQSNSYFCRAFGTSLTEASDFMLGFDLQETDTTGGVNPSKP